MVLVTRSIISGRRTTVSGVNHRSRPAGKTAAIPPTRVISAWSLIPLPALSENVDAVAINVRVWIRSGLARTSRPRNHPAVGDSDQVNRLLNLSFNKLGDRGSVTIKRTILRTAGRTSMTWKIEGEDVVPGLEPFELPVPIGQVIAEPVDQQYSFRGSVSGTYPIEPLW